MDTKSSQKNKKAPEIGETEYYLGVDWGKKLTGLAICDNETKIVTALCEVSTDLLLEEIRKISQENHLAKVVLGFSDQEQYDDSKKEIEKLEENLIKAGFSLSKEEESFTTIIAQQNLSQIRKKGITKNDNAEAARIILQSWIDKNI